MKNIAFFICFFMLTLAFSCKKDDDFGEQSKQQSDYAITNGIYIVNEGNFNSGNSSISFLQFDPLEMKNNAFYSRNSRPLGDVAQHIVVQDDLAYIVVNNSAKIEVVNTSDFTSVATINGLNSPRYMQIVNDSKAFVTDLYSDSIVIINLAKNEINGYINVGCATNNILWVEDKIYATNWTGDKVVFFDTAATDVGSIQVVKEPNSMIKDKNGMLWVMCTGGYMHEENAALVVIDPQTNTIFKQIEFEDQTAYPSRLVANSTLDTLYFINGGVFRMSIEDDHIPSIPLIDGSGYNFYGLAIDPNQNIIYVTDANDFMQSGYLYRFNFSGDKIDSFATGVIPG